MEEVSFETSSLLILRHFKCFGLLCPQILSTFHFLIVFQDKNLIGKNNHELYCNNVGVMSEIASSLHVAIHCFIYYPYSPNKPILMYPYKPNLLIITVKVHFDGIHPDYHGIQGFRSTSVENHCSTFIRYGMARC